MYIFKSLFKVIFFLFIYSNLCSQSISFGGAATYSSHTFLKFTEETSLVVDRISEGEFESMGQNFFVSVSSKSLEHVLSLETGFGNKFIDEQKNEFLGIKYYRLDYTFMYNLIASKYKKPSGSFGIGVSSIRSDIRRSWIHIPELELGLTYDRRFWDVGFSANFMGSYGLKHASLFLQISTNYYLKTTLLDLQARFGFIFSIKRGSS